MTGRCWMIWAIQMQNGRSSHRFDHVAAFVRILLDHCDDSLGGSLLAVPDRQGVFDWLRGNHIEVKILETF